MLCAHLGEARQGFMILGQNSGRRRSSGLAEASLCVAANAESKKCVRGCLARACESTKLRVSRCLPVEKRDFCTTGEVVASFPVASLAEVESRVGLSRRRQRLTANYCGEIQDRAH